MDTIPNPTGFPRLEPPSLLMVPLVTEERLARLYVAASRARALGFFRSAHGPLAATAWVHVGIRQLEQIEATARRVVEGDLDSVDHLRTLLARPPRWTPKQHEADRMDHKTPEAQHHEGSPAPQCALALTPRSPVCVAMAGVILDRLAPQEGRPWVERVVGYYLDRAIGVNRALVAAEQTLALQISLQRFVAVLGASDFLQTPVNHMGHDSPVPAAEVVLVEDEEMAAALEHPFRTVVGAAHEYADLPVPAFLHHIAEVAPSLTLSAADRDLTLTALARDWTETVRRWQVRPTASGVPNGIVPRTRDEPRDRCVVGQPQLGGQWETPNLRATETDDKCRPAMDLERASSKAYGRAGAELIKAQNEWVEAKECYKDANAKRGDCIKREDHGYDKCTEERDEGKEDCARREDRGYRNCCTWWPCSSLCKAWVWISNIVCVVWVWLSNIVCVVWTWIKNIVCVAWAYIAATLCAFFHISKGLAHAVRGLAEIGKGIALRTGAGVVGRLCDLVGIKGQTRTTSSLKVVGVHAALLHTGKVLLFSYDEGAPPITSGNPADFTAIGDSDRALCALWDPAAGQAHYVPLKRNLFCSHHAFTENGDLFVAGGQFPLPGLLKSLFPPELLAPGADRDMHAFMAGQEVWSRWEDMEKGRWYPTCVTLPDGRILIVSGTNGYATERGLGRGIQDSWQIADPRTKQVGVRRPLGFNVFHLYPFMHLLPSGKVFLHFMRTTALFDPASGTFGRAAAGGAGNGPGSTQHPFSRTGPGPGTCVLLPLVPRRDARTGEVSYPAGRVLVLGGGGAEKQPEPEIPGVYELNSDTPATNTAEILDFGTSDPQWRFTREFMHAGRVMPDAILLPTGKVLVLGGGSVGQSGGLLAHFTTTDLDGRPNKGARDPVREPELFDPETETWTRLCPKPLERLYHTSALLLPDGRVLVAGHDGALNMPPFDSSQYALELYSPPYLFGPDTLPAQRPIITAAPERITHGQIFTVSTPEARSIETVALIRQSSTTHQINTDQRYVGLAIHEVQEQGLSVQAPPTGAVAPPGYYMLFVVNRAGVPSVGRWVRIGAP